MEIRGVRIGWGWLLAAWFVGGAGFGFAASLPRYYAAVRRAEKAEQDRDEAKADAKRTHLVLDMTNEELRQALDRKRRGLPPPKPSFHRGFTLATRCLVSFFQPSFAVSEMADGRRQWLHESERGVVIGAGESEEEWQTVLCTIVPGRDEEEMALQFAAAQALLIGFSRETYRGEKGDWVAKAALACHEAPDGASVTENVGPLKAEMFRVEKVYVLRLEAR